MFNAQKIIDFFDKKKEVKLLEFINPIQQLLQSNAIKKRKLTKTKKKKIFKQSNTITNYFKKANECDIYGDDISDDIETFSDFYLSDNNNIEKSDDETHATISLPNVESIMASHINKMGGKEKDVKGDGNCVLYSVLECLDGKHNWNHLNLRKALINEIKRNKEKYIGFVDDINEYIYRMSQDKEFIDALGITALSNVLKLNIIVHQYAENQGSISTFHTASQYKDQIHLCSYYMSHYKHYKAIIFDKDEMKE